MVTDYQRLYSGISKAAWGYVFLYFNININEVSLLPSFIGYLLFLAAIRALEGEERELSLLKTFCVILAVWNAAVWISDWGFGDLEGRWPFADLLISLINIYFQFQFVTNLASIAEKYRTEDDDLHEKMLKYRTWQTIILTVVTISTTLVPSASEIWKYLSFGMAILYLILVVCLMKALFDLRACIRQREGEEAPPQE